MIGTSVSTILKTFTGSTLLNGDGTYRIYPNYVRMGDKQYPQLVYDCENYSAEITLDNSDALGEIEVKILCVDATYDGADALAKVLCPPASEPEATPTLDGFRGAWGATTIKGCFLEEVSEDHFVDTDMETILYYTKELTFKVIFTD